MEFRSSGPCNPDFDQALELKAHCAKFLLVNDRINKIYNIYDDGQTGGKYATKKQKKCQ